MGVLPRIFPEVLPCPGRRIPPAEAPDAAAHITSLAPFGTTSTPNTGRLDCPIPAAAWCNEGHPQRPHMAARIACSWRLCCTLPSAAFTLLHSPPSPRLVCATLAARPRHPSQLSCTSWRGLLRFRCPPRLIGWTVRRATGRQSMPGAGLRVAQRTVSAAKTGSPD